MADMEVGDEGGCCGIVCDMALDEGCRLRILIYLTFLFVRMTTKVKRSKSQGKYTTTAQQVIRSVKIILHSEGFYLFVFCSSEFGNSLQKRQGMKHVFSAGCTLNRRKNEMEIRSARHCRLHRDCGRQPTMPPQHMLSLRTIRWSRQAYQALTPLRSSTLPFHQQSEPLQSSPFFARYHLTSSNFTLTSPYCAFLGTAPCWPPTNLLISVASVACLIRPFTVSHPCLTTGGVPWPAIIASTLATAWAIAPCTKLLWEYLARTNTV